MVAAGSSTATQGICGTSLGGDAAHHYILVNECAVDWMDKHKKKDIESDQSCGNTIIMASAR